MNVLLVEDEVGLADVLARYVGARGHKVTSVATAQGAVDSVNAHWPDAVVLDVNLPDGSGWDVLRRIGPEKYGGLRVVVISAAPLSQKRLDEFKPARWFLKPFPLDALIRSLSATPPEEAMEVD